MLHKIIEFSVKNKLIVALMVLAMALYGIYETTRLPIDAVPDITNNQVQVITQAPSYGALDIERLVTFPVEQSCTNIQGMKEIRSFSRFGLSLVTIVFEDNVDVYWARQQVSERLTNAKNVIPAYIGVPELGPISTGLGEIYQYVIRPKKGYEHKYDITELRTIQDWIVRRQLLGVKGVAEVSSFGGKLKQYQISIIPEKLQALNISIDEVFSALEKNNQNTGGGYIEKGPNVVFIRSEGLVKNVQDIENIAISRKDGSQIMIRDIAEVNIGSATRYGAMCYNDEGEVSGAIVMMLKGANSSEVIDLIKQKVELIQKTLPEGVVIEPFLDRTKMVNNAIHTVRNNLIEGALIVLFVLVIFLGNFRAGLLVASVIPLSLLFAIIMMNLFGVGGNLMSLGALDFGLIVDGAVIIVEAVVHKLSHSINKSQSGQAYVDETVVKTGNRMMKAAIFGQLIILMVYLPIFSLEGIEGKMFKPMAQTVSFALLGAFLLSLTYVPMMSSWLLNTNLKGFDFSEKWILKLDNFYLKNLQKSMQHSRKIIVGTIVIFVVSVVLMMQLGGEFIPTLEEGDFAVDTRVLTGSNLNTTIEYTQKAAHSLKKNFPEVEKVVTKIGSGEVPTDPMPMEASDMMVILKDKSEWTSAKTFDELAEKMSAKLKEIPGLSYGFQYPVQMRFNELMTGARQDVVLKLFGENLDTLAHYAAHLGKLSAPIEGVESIYVEPISGMPQVVIQYDRQQLAYLNLTISEVNQIVNTAMAGRSAGMVFEDEKRFDLVVKLSEEKRDIENIENLMIPTPSGNQVQLRQLAEVKIVNGPNQIQREDAKRRIVVGFNVRNRDVQSVVAELKSSIDKSIKFPSGYYIHYGGAFENLEKATQRLMIVVPISLLMIFVMLYFAFGQVRLALMIYSAIPLSAIGGIWFLALRGMPFSISAGIGFIALFGVAVLNGIVLISEFNRLKLEGETDIYKIVFNGAKVRLRPVMMTALVASLGFFPMAFSNGSGAEVQRPLATVVIGGLVVATFLTLFILPIIYVLFESKNMKKIAVVCLGFLFMYHSSSAQQSIPLSAAMDTAIVKNKLIRNASLKAKIKEELIKSGSNIPKTQVQLDYGRFNSNFFDNKISISQAIPFPGSMSSMKQVKLSDYNLAVLDKDITTLNLKKEVAKIYAQYVLLKKKEQLWLQMDSLLHLFVQKTELKFAKGDANLLEKTSAVQHRNLIKMELDKIVQEIEFSQTFFNYLLHSEMVYIPAMRDFERLEVNPNLSKLTHPMLNYQKELIKNSELQFKNLKAQKTPDFILGLSSTTIQGFGADNIEYTSARRFNALTFGLQVPIFTQGINAQIRSSKLNQKLAENELEVKQNDMEIHYKHIYNQFTLYKEIVTKYEQTELNNAHTILNLGNKQLLAGEINYLEWSMLAQQSIQTKFSYIDALAMMYQNYINLQFFTLEK